MKKKKACNYPHFVGVKLSDEQREFVESQGDDRCKVIRALIEDAITRQEIMGKIVELGQEIGAGYNQNTN